MTFRARAFSAASLGNALILFELLSTIVQSSTGVSRRSSPFARVGASAGFGDHNLAWPLCRSRRLTSYANYEVYLVCSEVFSALEGYR
jgi:hypothetical protein